MPHAAFWFALAGVTLFVSAAILGALQFESYSHVKQYISESYAVDAPYGELIRFLAYLPAGFSLCIFAFVAINYLPPSKPAKAALSVYAIFYGLATALIAFFPCDAGCNREWINPSNAQIMHNLIGFSTYVFVPPAIVVFAFASKPWPHAKYLSAFSFLAGLMAVIMLGILFKNPGGDYIGLIQRIIETCILSWSIIVAVYVKQHGHD